MTHSDLAEDIFKAIRAHRVAREQLVILVSPDFLGHLAVFGPRSEITVRYGRLTHFQGVRLVVDPDVESYEILISHTRKPEKRKVKRGLARRLESMIALVSKENGLSRDSLIVEIHPDSLEALQSSKTWHVLERDPWRFERTQLIVTTDVDEFEVKPLTEE